MMFIIKSLVLLSVATALRSSPIQTQDLDKVAAAHLAAYRADTQNMRAQMHKASSAQHDNQRRLLSKFASETVNTSLDRGVPHNASREVAWKTNAAPASLVFSNITGGQVQVGVRDAHASQALGARVAKNASRTATDNKSELPVPPNASLKVIALKAQDGFEQGNSVQEANMTHNLSSSFAENAGMDRKIQQALATNASSKVELQKSEAWSHKDDAVQGQHVTRLSSNETNNIIRYASSSLAENAGMDRKATQTLAANTSSKIELQKPEAWSHKDGFVRGSHGIHISSNEKSDITHSMVVAHVEHVANKSSVSKGPTNISRALHTEVENDPMNHSDGHLTLASQQAASSVRATHQFGEQHVDDVSHKQAARGGAPNMTTAVAHEEILMDSVFHDLELETRTQTAADAWTKAMADLGDMASDSEGGRKAHGRSKTAAEAWAKMGDMASKLGNVVSNSGGDHKSQMSKSLAHFENATGNMTLLPRHHFDHKTASSEHVIPPAAAPKAISSGERNLLHGTAVRKADVAAVHKTDVADQQAVSSHKDAKASAQYLADRHAKHLADKVRRANQRGRKAPLSEDVARYEASTSNTTVPNGHEVFAGKHVSIAFDLANMAAVANSVDGVLHNDTRRRLVKKITEEWERNVINATGLGKSDVAAVHRTDVADQQAVSSQAAVHTEHVVSKVKVAAAPSTGAASAQHLADLSRVRHANQAGRKAPSSKDVARYDASTNNTTLLPRHHFADKASMAMDLANMAAAVNKVEKVLQDDARPTHKPHAMHKVGAELNDYLSTARQSESEAAQKGLRTLMLSLIPKKTSVLVDGVTLHGV